MVALASDDRLSVLWWRALKIAWRIVWRDR